MEDYENTPKKEVEFPFEPNEKVKAAFRTEFQMKAAVRIMTEALVATAAEQCGNPFEVLRREHPEVYAHSLRIFYDHATRMIDIKTNKD